MTYHKTWFSYVLWVIYTMLCAIFLVFAGNYVWASYLRSGGLTVSLADRTVQVAGFVMFPVMAVLYWIIRLAALKIRKRVVWKERTRRILEAIAVLSALALGIFLRVVYASEYITLLNTADSGALADMNGIEYFNMAVVTADGLVDPPTYGAARLYVSCLSLVLTFLGNKIASAVLFQVALQIAVLMLAYAVTRKLAGRIPACAALFYLACSAGCLEMLKNLGPECVYFVLYMIEMLAAAGYVKSYCANRLRRGPMVAGAVFTGVLIGILGYLDLTAFTILTVMTAILTGKKKRPEGVQADHSPIVGCVAVITVILSCAVGFVAAAAVVSAGRGISFEREMENWAALHIGNTRTFGFRPLYPYSMDMLLFTVLVVFAAFLVFEFFRSGREQNYMLWILLCIIAAPTPFAVIGVQPFGLLSMYIWGVLAGLGLQNCLLGGKARLMQSVIEEINQAAEEIGVTVGERKEEETADSGIAAAEETESAATEAEPSENKEEAGQRAESEGEKQVMPKPRYLENPLPLPKKHVPRQMDYQYQVEERDMKFDLEIKEDDDFDL